MKKSMVIFFGFTLFIISIIACSNDADDSKDTPDTISGTAAVGAPLIGGTVYIKDSTGMLKSALINEDGSYSAGISGMTGPFVLMAEGTYNSLPVCLYSTLQGKGLVNITPATNMIMALVLGNNPATLYPAASMKQDSTIVAASPDPTALNDVKGIFTGLFENIYPQFSIPSDFDVFSDSFKANGKGFDLVLDRVKMTTTDDSEGTTTVTISAISRNSSSETVYFRDDVEDTAGPSINNMTDMDITPYFISFKVNGVEKYFTQGDSDYENNPYGVVENGDYSGIYILAENSGNDANYVEIQIDDTEPGTYNQNDSIEEISLYYGEDDTHDYYSIKATLTLTAVNAVNGPIDGTFKGTFINWDDPTDIVEITQGLFSVQRIPEPSSGEE